MKNNAKIKNLVICEVINWTLLTDSLKWVHQNHARRQPIFLQFCSMLRAMKKIVFFRNISLPTFFQVTFKSWILTSEQKRTKLPKLGTGVGGFRWFGQCPKENVFFSLMSSLIQMERTEGMFLKVQKRNSRRVYICPRAACLGAKGKGWTWSRSRIRRSWGQVQA